VVKRKTCSERPGGWSESVGRARSVGLNAPRIDNQSDAFSVDMARCSLLDAGSMVVIGVVWRRR
jgi:hypothetical protein